MRLPVYETLCRTAANSCGAVMSALPHLPPQEHTHLSLARPSSEDHRADPAERDEGVSYEEEDLCAICLESLHSSHPACVTRCGHRFHESCFVEVRRIPCAAAILQHVSVLTVTVVCDYERPHSQAHLRICNVTRMTTRRLRCSLA